MDPIPSPHLKHAHIYIYMYIHIYRCIFYFCICKYAHVQNVYTYPHTHTCTYTRTTRRFVAVEQQCIESGACAGFSLLEEGLPVWSASVVFSTCLLRDLNQGSATEGASKDKAQWILQNDRPPCCDLGDLWAAAARQHGHFTLASMTEQSSGPLSLISYEWFVLLVFFLWGGVLFNPTIRLLGI